MKMNNTLPKPTAEIFEKKMLLKASDKQEELLALLNSYDWSAEVFEENGKFGLKSCVGEVLVPAKFDDLKTLSGIDIPEGGKVVVCEGGKWGVVRADRIGEWTIPPVYDEIGFPNTFAAVRKGDKWGVLNTNLGELVLPVEFDLIYGGSGFMFTNGMAYFEKDGKVGVMNDMGEFTDAIFDEAEPNDCGEIVVKLNGLEGFIDKTGQFTMDNDDAWFMESDF